MSRERIYAMLANDDENNKVAIWYNRAMVLVILACLIPLWFKETNIALVVVDDICVVVFIIDYLMRWATADFKLKRGKASFFLYPFTPMAIIDLLSILPSFLPLNGSLRAIRIIRVLRALRAFRLFHHARSVNVLRGAFRDQRTPLLVVLGLAIVYVIVSATVLFNVEPGMFNSFLDALYWSVISLTSIGYGDICPVTDIGRILTMISAFLGVAIIALPSGIIAAGLINELNKRDREDKS